MIKIAIADDEKEVLSEIKKIVNNFFTENRVEFHVDSYTSGEELLSSCQHYELIMLDIYMDGIDGIETAKKIRAEDKKVVLIYITNFGNEVSRSFSVHPFAFIEKPINNDKIYKNLYDYMEYIGDESDYKGIQFETQNGPAFFKPNEILYFEYLGNRRIRLITEKMVVVIQGSITNIFPLVCEYGFLKPHQSFIVNPDKIKAVLDLDLLMVNDAKIPIAQKKKSAVKEQIEEFLFSYFEGE